MENSPENIIQMVKSPKPDSSLKKREIPVEAEKLKQEIQTFINGRRLEDLSEAELKTAWSMHRKLAKASGIKLEDKSETPDLETLNQSIVPFLKETFRSWGNSQEAVDQAQITPSFQPPQTQNWQAKETDIDQAKFGEYTLNPETQNIDFENAKVIVPDLSQFEATQTKPAAKLSELAKYLVDTYGDKYHIPGIEYWQWLIQNPDKNPKTSANVNLKDGKWNFFFGSLLRDSNGHWSAPDASWNSSASEWNRIGDWLDSKWHSNCRVVLLEKN